MITRSEKVRLGIFLFVSLGCLIGTAALLAGYHFTRALDVYTVRFDESVSGLEVGAQVKYNGVRVGQITDIQIDTEDLTRVIATMALREGTPIKADTEAVLVSMGITGLRFVEITGGSKQSALLKPGAEIKSGRSFFGTLEGKAEDIAVKTEFALTKINQTLSAKNIQGVHEIIANVSDITGQISKLLKENDEKINSIIARVDVTAGDLQDSVASIKKTTKRLEGMLESADPAVAQIIDNVKVTTQDFRNASRSLSRIDKILKDIGRALDKFNGYIKEVNVGKIAGDAEVAVDQAKEMLKGLRRLVDASRGDIHSSARSLKKTLKNLEDLSADLKEQPSLLLKAKPPEARTSEERR